MAFRIRKSSSSLSRTRTSTPDPSSDTVPPVPPVPSPFLAKPYVSNALKYLTDDKDRARALQVAAEWRSRFAGEGWIRVVRKVERAKRGIFSVDTRRSTDPTKRRNSERQSRRFTNESKHEHWQRPRDSPPLPLRWPGDEDDAEPRRLRPWPRPLPRDNAFAQQGFWAAIDSPTPTTPRTAIPPSPTRTADPNRPRHPEARAAYDRIVSSVAGLTRPSASQDNDAAAVVLDRYCTESSPPLGLPGKLARFSVVENELLDLDAIRRAFERVGMPRLSHGRDGAAAACFDAMVERGEVLRRLRGQKEKVARVRREGVRAAWAVYVVARLEAGREGEAEGDEDDGYEYGNFLRSMQREGSAAWSLSAAETQRSSARSRAFTVDTSPSKSARWSAKSTSRRVETHAADDSPPKSPRRILRYDSIPPPNTPSPHRSSAPSASRTSPTSSPSKTPRRSLPSPSPSLSPLDNNPPNKNTHTRPPLTIRPYLSTATTDPPAPSHAEKEERRRGPNLRDLTTWAEELRGLRSETSSVRSGSTVCKDEDGEAGEGGEMGEMGGMGQGGVEFIPLPPPSAVFPSALWATGTAGEERGHFGVGRGERDAVEGDGVEVEVEVVEGRDGRGEAEREWVDEMQRLHDREMERQAREREREGRGL